MTFAQASSDYKFHDHKLIKSNHIASDDVLKHNLYVMDCIVDIYCQEDYIAPENSN